MSSGWLGTVFGPEPQVSIERVHAHLATLARCKLASTHLPSSRGGHSEVLLLVLEWCLRAAFPAGLGQRWRLLVCAEDVALARSDELWVVAVGSAGTGSVVAALPCAGATRGGNHGRSLRKLAGAVRQRCMSLCRSVPSWRILDWWSPATL